MIAPSRVVERQIIEQVGSYYAGTRVVVTGGASFIGSHLVEALLETGAVVLVADNLSSGSRSNLAQVMGDVEFIEGDLRDEHVARRACSGRTMIFHLAALHGGRGYIETHPVECMNNMLLDHVVFNAAAKAGLAKIVHASSACVYPTVLQADENDRGLLKESDASFDEAGCAYADGEYGWAKLMGEMQLRAFHKQYGLDGIACRIFTSYGERENESHAAVALIAKAVARLDPYPVWGNGLQTRNFTYVGDTVAGLLLGGAKLGGFDAFNVGSETHYTVNELMDEIFSVLDWRPSVIDRQLDKPVGVKSRAADCTKCRSALGWEPTYSLHEGVERTARWYESSVSASRLRNLEAVLMSR
jgi:UDP-glucose 4-epimerase